MPELQIPSSVWTGTFSVDSSFLCKKWLANAINDNLAAFNSVIFGGSHSFLNSGQCIQRLVSMDAELVGVQVTFSHAAAS